MSAEDFPPTPAEIQAARAAAGWTQAQAAEAAEVSLRTWQQWEAGDRKISRPAWVLFRIRSGEIPAHPG